MLMNKTMFIIHMVLAYVNMILACKNKKLVNMYMV